MLLISYYSELFPHLLIFSLQQLCNQGPAIALMSKVRHLGNRESNDLPKVTQAVGSGPRSRHQACSYCSAEILRFKPTPPPACKTPSAQCV